MVVDTFGIGDALPFEAAVESAPGGIIDASTRLRARDASLFQSPANCSFHAGQWSVSVQPGLPVASRDQSVLAIPVNPVETRQKIAGQPPAIRPCRYAVLIR